MFLKSLKKTFLPKTPLRLFSSNSGFYASLSLTPQQKDLRQAIQKFSTEEIKPIADQIDREDKFPRHLWPKLGELGLLGITAPTQYGGTGLTYFQHCLAMEELSKASGSVALSYGGHSNLMVNQLKLNGSEEQKKKYMPKLCSGQHVGALAMSEVGAGSDVVGMKTTAKFDSSKKKWIMNGGKMWITNASEADVLIIYAKTPKHEGDRTITAFIVEKKMKGFSIAQKLSKLGMRGSPTCEIVLDNVQIPQENVLGGVGNGVYVLMSGLNSERLVLAAGPIGLMQACMDLTMGYITQREQFGKKIGEFQLMQGKVADMYVQLQTARSFVYNLARQASDQGAEKVGNKECAAAILYSAETGTQMALQTIQALGGNGYTNEYPSGRYLRDAKLYEIGAGTSEIRRLIVGRQLFKQFS